MSGELHVILGPMFSGKTGKLLHHLSIYSTLGWSVLYINSNIDTRGEQFSTHNTLIKPELNNSTGISMIKADMLGDIDISSYQVIGIDEAQFFGDLAVKVEEWTDIDGKIVYAAGLDGDCFRQKFGQILDLIPLSNTCEKLEAYCLNCSRTKARKVAAAFSKKLPTQDDSDQVDVGAADKYVALCRDCWFA